MLSTSQPRIVLIGDNLEVVERLIRKIDARELSSLDRVRDKFRLETLIIDPEREDTWLDDCIRGIAGSGSPYDLILIDLFTQSPFVGGMTARRNLALEVKRHFTNASVGVFSRFDLGPRDRTILSCDGFALILEQINDMVDGHQCLVGDDWCRIFDSVIEGAGKTTLTPLADSVSMRFEFPEEASVACSRYLLYFAQLLKDFNVEASCELRENSGEVLFTAIPIRTETALDNITEALFTYLHLPSTKIEPTKGTSAQKEIVLRLVNKISELRRELSDAATMIDLQERSIDRYQQLLEGTVMLESLREVRSATTRDADVASLFGGFVEIGSPEYKGFALKLGRLINHIKKLRGS